MITKSFCNIQRFVLNVPNNNADVGELTTYAETYSKEIGVYADPDFQEYTIYNFHSKDNAGARVLVPSPLVSVMIELCDIVVQNASKYPGEHTTQTIIGKMMDNSARLKIDNVAVGPMLTWDGYSVCSWFSFSSTQLGVTNTNTVWLSIDSFLRNYSEYELVMVPPVDNLNLFFQPPATVRSMLAQTNIAQTMSRVQLARGSDPETTTHADVYDYVDPTDPSIRVPVPWIMLIYGGAGNNRDLIREELINYILSNSTSPRSDWAIIFPDIFKVTEFVIAPFWQNMAIPARALNHGVFSPALAASEITPQMSYACPNYSNAHLVKNTLVLSHVFRSMQLAVCGGMENRGSLFKITDLYPDYITVPTTSTDFNRMSQETQRFALLLSDLLSLADVYDDNTNLPFGTTRTMRNNLRYLVRSIDNTQYLVLAKMSAPSLVPE